MIKTAITVNICAADAQTGSYLINGMHLGLLSAATQNTHIQTCHRPVQYYVAIRNPDDPLASASLAHHRHEVNAWQEFLPILIRRSSTDLNALLQQYHLQPDLLVCLDENRLLGWLPNTISFFLLREGELRRLRPVKLGEPVFSETYHDKHSYYSLQISADDFYLILSPDLISFFNNGEIADLLLGLRQLPAKMGELLQTARQRGYQADTSWLAIQILRLEEDQKPGNERKGLGVPLRKWFSGSRQTGQATDADESDTESMSHEETEDPQTVKQGKNRRIWPPSRSNWPFWLIALTTILLLVFVLTSVFGGNLPAEPTDESTEATEPTVTTAATTTARPTTAPTATPVPTEPQQILIVTARQLNFRDEPTRQGRLLGMFTTGDRLIQLAEPENDWIKVEDADGRIGFVYAPYVTPEESFDDQ